MKPTIRSVIALGLAIVLSPLLFAATGTITPSPYQLVLDNNSNVAALACVWTYTAGTSTPVATYTDVGLSVANSNPIIANTAGRFTAFLTPGVSYKLIYELAPCSSISHGTNLLTADNIAATPTTANNVDVVGTAGEALTAGQCVYLSDGSGSKTAGQWFKCDSANTYSSTTPEVGLVPSSIASAATGTIRLSGSVTGLSSLSVGATYYVGIAGALTSTAPTNKRLLGQADTTTSLVLSGNPPTPVVTIVNLLACGRLTLTTALPVTTADVTAATTVYYTPISGCNQVTLWDGAANQIYTLTETSVAVPATTNTNYDVFAFANGTAVNIEALAWTNDTTRATAISLQNGYLAKASTPARRYIGSFRTTGVSGQTEDSVTSRYVWNYYNRVDRLLQKLETTTSWTYGSATFHSANASSANAVNVLIGFNEDLVEASVEASWSNATASNAPLVGIGLDSTSAVASNQSLATTFQVGNSGGYSHSQYRGYVGIGKHTLNWLEAVVNSGTAVTFVSNTATVGGLTTGASIQSGISGRMKG